MPTDTERLDHLLDTLKANGLYNSSYDRDYIDADIETTRKINLEKAWIWFRQSEFALVSRPTCATPRWECTLYPNLISNEQFTKDKAVLSAFYKNTGKCHDKQTISY